ncbi:MAG: pimeloyl-ACP methyl ester esterase BioH [Methylomicrobium sp.]|nr:pimeloyl-ACP methyl ester esterase BioH [Methylomicrobium sp.]
MTLHVETYGQGQPLVMVHGWAMHSGIWRSFARRLAAHYRVYCVDLPGHGLSRHCEQFSLPHICEALAQQLPNQPYVWLGWSLGGMVAVEMARLFPDRVKAIALLASNPCFVVKTDWPGIREPVLDSFAEQLSLDCQTTLLRFLSLQINGLENFKALSKTMKAAVKETDSPEPYILQQGLTMLKNEDLRPAIRDLKMPMAAIFGDRDSLVPVSVGPALQVLNPSITVKVMNKAAHAPFLSHETDLLELITDFVN